MKYEDIVNKIKEGSGLNDEEIKTKVESKLKQLSGLVSKEGAAHIVANELKIKIFDLEGKRLKISEIYGGMRSVEVVGKVLKLYDVREFKKENREGKVGSFLVGDETGIIRIVMWDLNLIKELEDSKIKEEDIIQVKNGYVKDNSGFLEVHMGERAKLFINPEGESVGNVKFSKEGVNKKIEDLQVNDNNVSVIGTVVQLFEPKFFEVCEVCNKRVKFEDGKYNCDEHKEVMPKFVPVLNMFFDDGSANIRTVAFRDNVEKILGMKSEELREKLSEFEMFKNKTLGNQLRLTGRVTKNDMFDRLEFVINDVEEVDADQLIEELEVNEN